MQRRGTRQGASIVSKGITRWQQLVPPDDVNQKRNPGDECQDAEAQQPQAAGEGSRRPPMMNSRRPCRPLRRAPSIRFTSSG